MTINPLLEQRRQDYLDALYLLDGRDNPAHPHYATYTGLYIQHLSTLVSRDMKEVLAALNPAT